MKLAEEDDVVPANWTDSYWGKTKLVLRDMRENGN